MPREFCSAKLGKLATQSVILITISFISLLFTSCLADVLNKKFGYSVPVVIHYSTDYGTIPKAKKLSAGQALTADDLPELSENGYIFDGWYSDQNYTNRILEGTVLGENTTLYARWIPRNDIPFTIYNYILDPRTTGQGFALRSEYTQHLTGTTHAIIKQEDYDICTSSFNTGDLDKYQLIYLWDSDTFDKTSINPDGSTVVNNYYYLNRIYDYEFEQIIRELPDTSWCYWFDFRDRSSNQNFSFSSIAYAIRDTQRVVETYFDNSRNNTRNRYNKHYALIFGSLNATSIPSYAFENVGALNQVNLPQACTYISTGAFYGCEDLEWVYTDNTDYSKSWKTYDNNGNWISLGSNPNPREFADRLRTSNNWVQLE